MDWRRNVPDRDPHLLPSFQGACSMPGAVCFQQPCLQPDGGVPVEIGSASPRGVKELTHPSGASHCVSQA